MKYTKEQAKKAKEKLEIKSLPDVKIEYGYYIVESKMNYAKNN
jgi:hypothetical protein